MIIKIEDTPDNNVRNFYPEHKLQVNRTTEYTDVKSLRKSPLAEAIFDIGGIKSVLIATDMISVKKTSDATWDDLSPQIMSEILDFMATGAQADMEVEEETPQDLMQKILTLIDARIRPFLQKDGGDIEVKNFENGILYVELTGRCGGCPYAMRTLKEGVEKILKNYISQIKEVKPYNRD
jgi:Fe-S cluster biogenesis protein NfuA